MLVTVNGDDVEEGVLDADMMVVVEGSGKDGSLLTVVGG